MKIWEAEVFHISGIKEKKASWRWSWRKAQDQSSAHEKLNLNSLRLRWIFSPLESCGVLPWVSSHKCTEWPCAHNVPIKEKNWLDTVLFVVYFLIYIVLVESIWKKKTRGSETLTSFNLYKTAFHYPQFMSPKLNVGQAGCAYTPQPPSLPGPTPSLTHENSLLL